MSVRGHAWRAGAPFRALALGAIHLYRVTLSGWLGGQCRFSPTCSHYAEVAIREHGALRGTGLAVWRLARCNPYCKGGIDPVPPRRRRSDGADAGPVYDSIVRASEEAHA
jgi:putative membrane protein insertion efficiency factor